MFEFHSLISHFHFISPSLPLLFQRGEKNKEYDLFVLKIQKLEKLCRALQEERKGLYDKIKEVRQANSSLPSKLFPSSAPETEVTDDSVLTPVELQELQQLQEEIPALTEDMSRLKDEQAKLQELADSLLATPADKDEEEKEDFDIDEDDVAAAFAHFQTKSQVKEHLVDMESGSAESLLPQVRQAEIQIQGPPTSEEKTSETTPTEPKPEEVKDQSQDEEIQQQHSEATPELKKVQFDLPTEQKQETVEKPVETSEVKPVVPEEEKTAQPQPAEPVQVTEAPTQSEPAPVSENMPQATATASDANSSKKQAPKKKKKRNGKNAS